jgi:hypothetical protein
VSLADHPFHGPIHHLGYVVEDLETTVQRLVSGLGAGPFFVVRDVPLEEVTSRCEAATFQHDSAFGQCGAMPIEVMQLKRLEPERVREGSRTRRRTCTTPHTWWRRSVSPRPARISSDVGSPRSCTRPWATST